MIVAQVTALVALLTLGDTAASEAVVPTPPEPLNVSQTVTSDRSPWPERTLVMLWLESGAARIYPLPLLDKHGTLLTGNVTKVAATWSPKTATAVLVALPRACRRDYGVRRMAS